MAAVLAPSEPDLIARVKDRRAAGDRDGMLKAVADFWVHLGGPGTADHGEAEVWKQVVAANAESDAVRAGVDLLRHGHVLRLSAFTRLVQNIIAHDHVIPPGEDPSKPGALPARAVIRLEELATLVIERGWARYGYLDATLFRFVDGKARRQLWEFLAPRLRDLHGDDDSWRVIAVLLVAVIPGSEWRSWLSDWERRRGVPMWLVASYISAISDSGGATAAALTDIARRARARLPTDATLRYLAGFELEIALLARDYDAFLALFDEHGFDAATSIPGWEHPLIQHINGFKHGHHIRQADFERVTMPDLRPLQPMQDVDMSPPNRELVEHVRTQIDYEAQSRRCLCMVAELLRSEGQGSRHESLAREYARMKLPASLFWFRQEWPGLFRSRVPWTRRLMMKLFP